MQTSLPEFCPKLSFAQKNKCSTFSNIGLQTSLLKSFIGNDFLNNICNICTLQVYFNGRSPSPFFFIPRNIPRL